MVLVGLLINPFFNIIRRVLTLARQSPWSGDGTSRIINKSFF